MRTSIFTAGSRCRSHCGHNRPGRPRPARPRATPNSRCSTASPGSRWTSGSTATARWMISLPAPSRDRWHCRQVPTRLAITASDAADASAPVIGPVTVTLAASGNYTAVANLDAAGKPTANFFTNDVSQIAAGKGKLTVRHAAAAPAVDVLAGGAAVVSNLANPNGQTLSLDPGTVSAAVAATGTTAPVIGPADVTVAEGHAHDRVRVGQPGGQEPAAGGADHRRPALRTGFGPRRP